MYLRKILQANQTLGVTLPKEYAQVLGFKRRDFAELSLLDERTIVIKKHIAVPQKLEVTR